MTTSPLVPWLIQQYKRATREFGEAVIGLEGLKSAATLRAALKLKSDIEAAKAAHFLGCPDGDISNELDIEAAKEKAHDAAELALTNQAFHCAALIHLNRRVLAMAQDDEEVLRPVKEIVGTLKRLRKGGTAETGFLFPMFMGAL